MSNLITEPQEIKKISDSLEILRSKGYNQNTIEMIIETLLPKNDRCVINYQIEESVLTAFFSPEEHLIKVSLNSLKYYLLEQTKNIRFTEAEDEMREELFRKYVIFSLLHEIEHVKQYFLSEGFIECPYRLVVDIYRNMLLLDCDKQILVDDNWTEIKQTWLAVKRVLFNISKHRNSHNFILERNANLVANDAMMKVCNYEDDLTFLPFFENQKISDLANGYFGIWNGPAERSYYKAWSGALFKSFSKSEEIPEVARVCYGLPVDSKTRIKILTKKFTI